VTRDRTPSILGHELAGVVTTLGYGTTGLSVGQRVFGLADWYRDGNPGRVLWLSRHATSRRCRATLTSQWARACQLSGLTAWQGLYEHGRLRAGQSVIAHGAARRSLGRW